MIDHPGFLEDIIKNPDDDVPRIIYADWLEEQGSPSSVARAQFIRVQIRIVRDYPNGMRCQRNGAPVDLYASFKPRCRCQPCRLNRREYHVSRQYIRSLWEWNLCPRVSFTCTWRRGFPERICLPLNTWRNQATTLLQAMPLRFVTLSDRQPFGREEWPGHVSWRWSHESLPLAVTDRLPDDIFRFLKPARGRLCKYYDSRSDALEACSRALLAWGRKTLEKTRTPEPSPR